MNKYIIPIASVGIALIGRQIYSSGYQDNNKAKQVIGAALFAGGVAGLGYIVATNLEYKPHQLIIIGGFSAIGGAVFTSDFYINQSSS